MLVASLRMEVWVVVVVEGQMGWSLRFEAVVGGGEWDVWRTKG